MSVGVPLATSRLTGRLVARASLDAATTRAMFDLLVSHFSGVDGRTFVADLAEKDWVILLDDEGGDLRGFSTLRIYETSAPGRPITVVYSGDTIVERTWWGSPALARTWIQTVRHLTPMDGGRELYWLLLTSGYRTYRFLPVFFRVFYPRYDELTPSSARTMVDAIATEQFGSRYRADTGIVRFERPQVLAPDLLAVPDGREADPHIAFFLERNPGYVGGDELVCLTPINDDNLTPAGRRMARLKGERQC
jgi:hypothetical protein